MFERRFLVSSAIALLVATTALPAFAQDAAIAETLYEEGQKLMADGKVAEACDKFAASHRMDPAPGTVLNLAACHEKLGKNASAWAEYREAKALAQRKNDSKRADYAQQKLEALEPGLRKVSFAIASPLPTMELKLDERPLVREAWSSAVALDPGIHKIEASAKGYKTWSTVFEIASTPGAEKVDVPALEPAPEEPAPAPVAPQVQAAAQPEESKPMSPATKRTIGYAVAGAGVVSLGVGIVMGIRAGSLASDRDAACPEGKPCFDQSAFDADHDARVAQQWFFITGAAGLVLGGIGAYLIVSNPDAPAASAKRITVVPQANANGGGLFAVGRF